MKRAYSSRLSSTQPRLLRQRDTVKVVPKLLSAAAHCQCRFVRKGESCGYAIKLSKRTVLHLPICLDLLLQANDLVRPLIGFAQRKEADYPNRDKSISLRRTLSAISCAASGAIRSRGDVFTDAPSPLARGAAESGR